MRQAILDFPQQLIWEPKLENAASLPRARRFVVSGMGGSHLAADLLKVWDPAFDLTIHKNYGLPAAIQEDSGDTLFIASSYSGNTEETLDFYESASKQKFPIAAVAMGGRLLEMAQKDGVPYVQIPDTGIKSRMALGFSLKALLKVMRKDRVVEELSGIGQSLKVLGAGAFEEEGRILAEGLEGYIPVIYASEKNYPIAYNWKIKFNESGKIPAFCNMLPELNHNEMEGWSVSDATRSLSAKFLFIFLQDSEDHPFIQKRMEMLRKLLLERKFLIRLQELDGVNVFHKIFASLLTADWTAYYTAKNYGADPMETPFIEEFKKLI